MTFVPRFPNAPVNYEHQNESQFRSQVLQALTASSSAVVLDGSLDDFFNGVLGDTLVHDGTQFVGSKRFTEDMEFSKQLIFYESTGGTQESTFDLIGGGGFSGASGALVTSGGINRGFTDISEASAQVGSFPSLTFDYTGTTNATVVNVGGTEGYTIQQTSSSTTWSYWPSNWYRTVPNGEGELLARVYMVRTGSGSRQRFGVGFAAVTFTSPGSGTYLAGGPGVVGFSFNNALRVTGIVHDAIQATGVTSTYFVPAFSDGWGWVRMRVADTSGGKMQYQVEVIPPGAASAKDSPPAFGGTWHIDQESTIAITRAAFDHTPGYYRQTSGPNQTGTRHLSYLSFSSDSTFAQGAPTGPGEPAYLQLRNLNNNLTKFWQTPLASILGAGNRETAFGLIRGNRTNDTGFELFNDEASGTGSQGIRLYKAGTGSYEPFYFRWGATTGLTILSPDDVGGPYWTFHDPLNFEGNALLDDDVRLELGTGQDYWFEYDSAATALQLWSTDVDGLGADGRLFEVVDGTDDIEFFGVVTGTGGFYTTAGGTLQGTWTDLGTVTTVDLNGGTIDGMTIGGAAAAAGTFTTLNATGGGALTGTWTDLGSVTTIDINGGAIDGTTIGGAAAAAGTFTTLSVSGDLLVATQTPASASATGTTGTITWDSDYIYVCTATDTWKRVAIATW
jgi:hypothetical protein